MIVLSVTITCIETLPAIRADMDLNQVYIYTCVVLVYVLVDTCVL